MATASITATIAAIAATAVPKPTLAVVIASTAAAGFIQLLIVGHESQRLQHIGCGWV